MEIFLTLAAFSTTFPTVLLIQKSHHCEALLLSPHVILGANPIRKGDSILSRQYGEAVATPLLTR
jgi:hypothetical protein